MDQRGEPLGVPDVRLQQVEPWIGWSANGTHWVWQTLSEAFGLTDVAHELTNIELAVASHFVIARVETGVFDQPETPGDGDDGARSVTYLPPRWFIATVE